MMTAGLIYNLGQTVLDSKKKAQKKVILEEEAKDPEENQIIEEYEGECDECKREKIKKSCPMCGL